VQAPEPSPLTFRHQRDRRPAQEARRRLHRIPCNFGKGGPREAPHQSVFLRGTPADTFCKVKKKAPHRGRVEGAARLRFGRKCRGDDPGSKDHMERGQPSSTSGRSPTSCSRARACTRPRRRLRRHRARRGQLPKGLPGSAPTILIGNVWGVERQTGSRPTRPRHSDQFCWCAAAAGGGPSMGGGFNGGAWLNPAFLFPPAVCLQRAGIISPLRGGVARSGHARRGRPLRLARGASPEQSAGEGKRRRQRRGRPSDQEQRDVRGPWRRNRCATGAGWEDGGKRSSAAHAEVVLRAWWARSRGRWPGLPIAAAAAGRCAPRW
jgi:hypothetical protein